MPFDRARDPKARELLKAKRREANAKRKAAMAADPRVQAMKQVLKERRHAAYEQAKTRRKAFAEEQKRQKQAREVEARAQRDRALMHTLRLVTDDDKPD